MRTRGFRVTAVVAAATVVLSAGCSSTVVGSAEPAGESAAPGGGAELSLGDLRTVDVCGLLPKDELAKIGRAEDRAGAGINECSKQVSLEKDNGSGGKSVTGIVDVKLTLESPATEADSLKRSYPTGFLKQQRGAITVYQGKETTGRCMRAATVEKGLLRLVAQGRNSRVTADTCEYATPLFDAMLAGLASGTVPRRTATASSLAGIDLCALVTNDMVKSAYNKDMPLSPQSGVFQCRYGANPMAGTLIVSPGNGFRPGTVPPMPGTRVIDIAGRPSTVHDMSAGDSGTGCNVELGHIAAETGGTGLQSIEMVGLFYLAPAGGGDACAQTTALATAIAGKLPAAS